MMDRAWWKTLLLVAAAALTFAPAYAMDGLAAVGAPAPDFTLEDQNGKEISLSDFEGKVVVLEWINWDCPFVQRHYESGTMSDLAEAYPNEDVVWLAINSTHYATSDKDKEWIEKYDLPYPILSDPSGEVGKAYGAKTTPHMYIIDPSGTLVYNGGIDDDPQGSSNSPTPYVKQALEQVVAGDPVTVAETQPYGCSVKYAK